MAPMGIAGILMILLSGGMPNELLDYMDTEAYWKAKEVAVSVETMTAELATPAKTGDVEELIKQLGDNDFAKREAAQKELLGMGTEALGKLKEAAKSEDAERSSRAKYIINQLTSGNGEFAVRRLMAIRTLGELKDAKATKTLETLLKSERLFEGEYAARAIAEIKGEAAKDTGPGAKALREDVWLLPKGTRTVAQVRVERGERIKLAEVLAKLPAEMGGEKGEEAGQRLTELVITAAEATGNRRLEAGTLGVSGDVGDESGFAVVVARGKYDRNALVATIKREMDEDAEVQQVEGEEVITLEKGQVELILSKGERVVLVAGPGSEADTMQAVKEMARALRTGRGGIKDEPEMVKLIEGAPEGEIFAVMKVTEAYREADYLSALDTLVLSTKRVQDGMEVKLVARGLDALAVEEQVKEFEKDRQEMLKEMDENEIPPEFQEIMKPFVEFAREVKVEREGSTVTLTGKLKGTTGNVIPLLGMFLFAMPVGHEMHADF